MKVEAKKILEEMRDSKANDRKRMSLYLSESAFDQFRKACDDIPPSRVLERLMKLFSEEKLSA